MVFILGCTLTYPCQTIEGEGTVILLINLSPENEKTLGVGTQMLLYRRIRITQRPWGRKLYKWNYSSRGAARFWIPAPRFHKDKLRGSIRVESQEVWGAGMTVGARE